MKTLAMPAIRRPMQRLGVGAIILALSTALAAPLPAVAKAKHAATVKVSQSSKYPTKPVKTKNTKNTKNRTTQTAKPLKKAHTAHKQRHAKPRGTQNTQKSRQSPATQASHTPRQAYYLIPANVGQVAQQQAPAKAAEAMSARDTRAGNVHQVGKASYYSAAFHGKKTASGEHYDPNALTCAHGSLPFGCRIRVINLSNRKSVEVKVNDRGAFDKHGRVVDLSKAAAQEIGMVSSGTAKVQIEVLE